MWGSYRRESMGSDVLISAVLQVTRAYICSCKRFLREKEKQRNVVMMYRVWIVLQLVPEENTLLAWLNLK